MSIPRAVSLCVKLLGLVRCCERATTNSKNKTMASEITLLAPLSPFVLIFLQLEKLFYPMVCSLEAAVDQAEDLSRSALALCAFRDQILTK